MTGRNIICISASEWGGNYAKTIVEISKELSTRNKLLYVDYPFTYKDLVQFIFKGDFQSVQYFSSSLSCGVSLCSSFTISSEFSKQWMVIQKFVETEWLKAFSSC